VLQGAVVDPNPLSRRLEELAALVGDEPEADAPASGTPVAAVRGEVAAMRADLVGLRSELGTLRTEVDAVSGRVTGAVAASRSETSALARRVGDLVALVDGVSSRLDEVRADLPGLSREVRDALELVPVRTGAKLDELTGKLADSVGTRVEAVTAEVRRTVSAALEREADQAATTQGLMSEARSSLESRMAVLEDTLDALAERLESVTRDGMHTVRDQVRDMTTSVVTIEQRLDAMAGEQVERIVARLRDVTEARLDALSLSLVDATRSRNEQLRRELLDMLERVSAEQEATRNQVALLVDAQKNAGTQQSQAISVLEAKVAETLGQSREDITTELDEVAERFLASAAALQAKADEQAAAQAARADALQTSLEAALEAVRTQLTAGLDQTRSDLVEEVGGMRPRLEEVAATLSGAAAADAAARAELGQALDAVRERVAIAVNVSADSVRAALEELSSSQADRTRTTHEALLDRLEDQHANVTARLADLAAGHGGTVAAERETAERLAALTTALDDVRRSVEALQGDWPARLDQATAAARTSAEGVLGEVRAEVRTQLDAELAEMARAAGGLDEAKVRLGALVDEARAPGTATAAPSVAATPATKAPARKTPVKQAAAAEPVATKAPAKKAPAK
jgi:hypothetical protein